MFYAHYLIVKKSQTNEISTVNGNKEKLSTDLLKPKAELQKVK